MKAHLLTLFVSIFFTGISCQEKVDIAKEQEAIKAVIEKSSQAWSDRDFEAIASTWVQDETATRIMAAENNYGVTEG